MKNAYDVIIVGTGVAGCFAALHLPENKEILMITKAGLEESDSFLAQGGICVLKDEDDYDAFFEDTMRAGHYRNKKESVEVMIRSSKEIIRELINYGVRFQMENGKLLFAREGAHTTSRILYHEDETGKEITSVLLKTIQKKSNITILTETTLLDIIEKENHCHGIIVKTSENEIKPVLAANVIWACGGIGGIYDNSTNYPHLTGDALMISQRHNIKLKNINYVQIHPTALYSEKQGRRFLISESVRGEGAVLYNKAGKRFVDELLPRDILTREIHKQMKLDKSPYVWLSMKSIKDQDISIRFPNIYKKCLEEGFDPKKEWIPVVPSQHYFMGGVWVNMKSKTSMEHLYAVGETSCNGVHGANRLASNSLLESLVFAKIAAQDITESQRPRSNKDSQIYGSTDWVELRKIYGIRKEDYQNSEKYFKIGKKNLIKEMEKEMRKGDHNESNNHKVKCG